MFHEMTLKLYFMKCLERKISQCILPLKVSQNSRQNTFARASFLIKLQTYCNFIKKETLSQVFSCEFCEVFKNTFLAEQLRVTASAYTKLLFFKLVQVLLFFALSL